MKLVEAGRADKETVINELFPGKEREKALTEFRNFKKRVNEKAEKAGLPLRIIEQEGKVMIADQKGVSAQSTKEIEKGSASAAKLSYEPIPPRAKSVRVKDGKIQIEIFVSYARKDKDRVKNF